MLRRASGARILAGVDRHLAQVARWLANTTLLLVAVSAPAGCFLDRHPLRSDGCSSDEDCGAGAECRDGQCVSVADGGRDGGRTDASADDAGADSGRPDAAPPDAAPDAGPPDAGPAHCRDGVLSVGLESDVDCGGPCEPCDMCRRCAEPGDCRNGACESGICRPELTTVSTRTGTVDAFVRADGAVLLAHYAPGSFHSGYDPARAQSTTMTGGATPPAGWAPDPCRESGHLPLAAFDPAGRAVTIECGTSYADIIASASSSALFASFSDGTWGTFGTVGSGGAPGWAAIAALGSGQGRGSHAMCGDVNVTSVGGVAYCDGRRTTQWDNHLASYSVAASGANPFVGCAGAGCNGPTCNIAVWVWLHP